MSSIVNKERIPYKIWNTVNKVWDQLFFITNAKSVDAADGKTLETKVGVINGITSDINCEDRTVAASAAMVNQLNSKIQVVSSLPSNPDSNVFYFIPE